MWKWILYYSIALLIGIIFAIFEWPFWVACVILFALAFVFICEVLFTLYGTKNIVKVEKFIKRKTKEPIYKHIYTQGFGTKEEQILAIDAILHKYKQQNIQHYYRCIQYILQDNLECALNEATKINKEPLKSYSKAFIHASMGNELEALSYPLAKTWMQEAILATIAHTKKDYISFETHANNAFSAARGIQKLSLVYSFNGMRS